MMLRKSVIQDSLSSRFSGPFEVVERKGPDIKLQIRRKNKWIHLDNVKRYMGSEMPITSLISP